MAQRTGSFSLLCDKIKYVFCYLFDRECHQRWGIRSALMLWWVCSQEVKLIALLSQQVYSLRTTTWRLSVSSFLSTFPLNLIAIYHGLKWAHGNFSIWSNKTNVFQHAIALKQNCRDVDGIFVANSLGSCQNKHYLVHASMNISVATIRSSDNDSTGFWPPGLLHTLSADGHI